MMGLDDKIENKAEELKGQGKEAVGQATDDDELKAEGQFDQAKGNIKQAGEKIKDIFKKEGHESWPLAGLPGQGPTSLFREGYLRSGLSSRRQP
jgi:uncharacterized protein YjbJ (UPF0337 family)